MAKQSRLHQIGRHGGAIEHHEGLFGAGAGFVQRFGEHLFARAGLALDDHRHDCGGQPLAQRIKPAHRLAAAHHPTEAGRCSQRDLGHFVGAFDLQHRRADDDGFATLKGRLGDS